MIKTVYCFGKKIQESNGVIYINREATEFSSIEEARTYIKNKASSEQLEEQITKELYEDLSTVQIAKIIKEHHDVKVTDTLIESYIELASSKLFTVDPVVQEIRNLNKLDRLFDNKIHYELEDGSVVAIDEQTQDKLNNLLTDHKDVVDYMRQSKENFFYVVEKIKE